MILKIVILILLLVIIAGKPVKPKGWEKTGKVWPPPKPATKQKDQQKSDPNEVIFSSRTGKMNTDFFTFCLILERKKNNKNLKFRSEFAPTKSRIEAIVQTTTLQMLDDIKSKSLTIYNVCYIMRFC